MLGPYDAWRAPGPWLSYTNRRNEGKTLHASAPSPQAISFETCRPLAEHARLVMDWRNDPATLAMSYHRQPKQWDSFLAEFQQDYFQDDPAPLFAHYQGARVGFLRFQPARHPLGLAGSCVDISINLAPEARGRGLGCAVLNAVSDHLRGLGVDSIHAEVRAENAASLKAFAAAGYDDLGAAEKRVDTGETAAIRRFVRELSSPFWRRGRAMVIAEAGSNWRMGTRRRDQAMAKALIDVAIEAGADAVKFQTYRPETVYVANAGTSDYLADNGIQEEIGDIFADLAMPYDMLGDLAAYCRQHGIQFMSTGFSPADFAAIDPHVALHKLASYEISHIHLIDQAARAAKPLVMSTGASAFADIAWAVERYHAGGGRDLCLMQCTARYPAPLDSVNVGALSWLRRRFGVPVGLSDHSRDPVTAPVAAIMAGARCIEKHYTLHNALPGPDHSFALDPAELALMVAKIREAEQVKGDGTKGVLPEERELAAFARRGIQALRPIQCGEPLREGDSIAILRPGKQSLGVHPRFLAEMDGRLAARDIAAGEGIRPGDWQ